MKRIVLSVLALAATPALAIGVSVVRCDTAVNTSAEADGRNQWVRVCAKGHVPDAMLEDAERGIAALNAGNPARKYYMAIFDGSNGQALDLPVSALFSCYTLPATHRVIGLCQAGCFTPEQLILTDTGYTRADSVASARSLVTLSPEATLEAPTFTTSPLAYTIKTLNPTTIETIRTFATADGGSLRVTLEHQLLDGTGYMRAAAGFVVGDELVRENGARVRIVSLTDERVLGRVFHAAPEIDSEIGNVLVAQGFLGGSHKTQARALANVNRLILRAGL